MARQTRGGFAGKFRIIDFTLSNFHEGRPYWQDVGTIDAYWEAYIDLVGVTPDLNLYDQDWPIWTYQEQLPPAKFVFDDEERRGTAVDSLVSRGCIISGSAIRRSLLFSNVHVHAAGLNVVTSDMLGQPIHHLQ